MLSATVERVEQMLRELGVVWQASYQIVKWAFKINGGGDGGKVG